MTTIQWTIFTRPSDAEEWAVWGAYETEEEARRILDQIRIDYLEVEAELRKVTTTIEEERLDA